MWRNLQNESVDEIRYESGHLRKRCNRGHEREFEVDAKVTNPTRLTVPDVTDTLPREIVSKKGETLPSG